MYERIPYHHQFISCKSSCSYHPNNLEAERTHNEWSSFRKKSYPYVIDSNNNRISRMWYSF